MLLKGDNKGSVMLLLILVIATVAMLGISIMCLSGINHKMKLTNSDIIENSYMSEAGIEEGQALALLVYDQIYTESENYLADLVSSINLDIGKISGGEINFSDSLYGKYMDINLKIDKDEVNKSFVSYFEKRYLEEIVTRFNNFSSKIDSSIDLDATIHGFSNHRATLDLTSKYKNNSITRSNSVRLTINSPTIECGYTSDESVDLSSLYNPLLSKPAFVQKNMYFKGNSSINGNLIVLGSLIDRGTDSSLNFASNDLAVYGNDIDTTELTGSIRLGNKSSINNVNTLYTNTVMYKSILYNIEGSIPGIDAANIILDSSKSSIENKSLGLGSVNVSDEFISNMKDLLNNIHLNPKNSVKDDKVDFDKAHPVQLLYDIRIGGNNDAGNTGFVSASESYAICSTNENSKSIYIFGPPYFDGKNKNDSKDLDSDNNPLNINARGIDSRNEIIYGVSSDSSFDLKGILVSAGDVHILGNVNFEGSIICMGNLYMEGDGNKTLVNNSGTHLADKLEDSGDKFYGAFSDYYKHMYHGLELESLDNIVRTDAKKNIIVSNWRVTYGQ